MNRYFRYGLIVLSLIMMVATYVVYANVIERKTAFTVTYDQFDRIVAVQYGNDVRFDRSTESGCNYLGAFKDALNKGFVDETFIKKEVVVGPEGPDLCDQIALKRLMDQQIDRERLEPDKVQATEKSSSESVLPYIGEDEDAGVLKHL